MSTLLVILGSSFGMCMVFTPLVRALARRCGLVDRPDGRRKMHAHAIPVAGGIAVLLSGVTALAIPLLTSEALREQLVQQSSSLLGLLAAAVVIALVGVADDFGLLRGRHKLLGQLVAVAIVIQSGLVVRHLRLFDWDLELGLLAVPFTACWLVGAINSLNLIDGMDGLLTSVGLIISLALTIMAALHGQWVAACITMALAGSLLGFLRYNFPPASIFLGDAGSMLIGLVVGAMAIQGSLKGPATVALAAPTALLTIPFFDTAAAIIRRKLTGRSIYTTDRAHLHHCLLRRGLSSRSVLLLISSFCLLTVLGALASLALHNELLAILAALAVIGILVASQLFGYAEFLLLKKRFLAMALTLVRGRSRSGARHLEVRLQGTVDWTELWYTLIACARDLKLVMLRLNVNAPAINEGYHARWDCPHQEREESNLWRAEFPLMIDKENLGRLEISGQRDHEPVSVKIATVAKLIERFEVLASGLIDVSSDLSSKGAENAYHVDMRHRLAHANESLRMGYGEKLPDAAAPWPAG